MLSFSKKRTSGLLRALAKLKEASKTGNFDVELSTENLGIDETEIIHTINTIISNYKNSTAYDLMKYQLANKAMHVALWDMDVVNGDPINPNNTFTWSPEFRQMLGFTDERDFPNLLSSWSDRIHPEDKERTINHFAEHLLDRTGQTPYDIKNRLQMKDGTYRYFHAFGDTMRDDKGYAVKVAGAVTSILLGITLGLLKLPLLSMPISMVLAFINIIADANETVDMLSTFIYTRQIHLVLNRETLADVEYPDLPVYIDVNHAIMIILINLVVVIIFFLISNLKNTLEK